MRHIARLLLLSSASLLWVAAASAESIVSFGTSTTYSPAPSGQATASNSALTYLGYSSTYATCPSAGCVPGPSITTYNIGTGGGVWVGPITGSSWVSFENSAPNSGNYPANGAYTYQTTFSAPAGDDLSLTVSADDTTAVYLNGVLEVPDAPMTTLGKCTEGTPNCTTETTYLITGLTASDTLTFVVDQDWDNATGLDFAGTVVPPAPEPSSLVLLGTGLLGAAGALRRRIRG